ncbi:hypothetical protein LPJ77_003251 [Coemansia sp. RSA 2523]|nr:hypothetical protein LPJ77_003251 [Coemansia sp. RSA 2523]
MTRYSKVLTRQNAQMFVGGGLLTLTLGYSWLRTRRERTAELQRRLRAVHEHMYWSMSLTQRTNVPIESELATYFRQKKQQYRILNSSNGNSWWNNKISCLSSWAAKPGYLTDCAILLQRAVSSHIAAGWSDAKNASNAGSRWMTGQIKDAVRWNAATKYLDDMWAAERSKWQNAHAYAVKTVHPMYSKDDVSDPIK